MLHPVHESHKNTKNGPGSLSICIPLAQIFGMSPFVPPRAITSTLPELEAEAGSAGSALVGKSAGKGMSSNLFGETIAMFDMSSGLMEQKFTWENSVLNSSMELHPVMV